jgi:hypothetical protein
MDTKDIPLKFPVTVDGNRVTDVVVRAPEGADMMKIGDAFSALQALAPKPGAPQVLPKNGDYAHMILIAETLCSLGSASGKLRLADLSAVTTAAGELLGEGMAAEIEIGES